ncbi:MAG: amidohydrolase family protein [Bacteroidetes bacterium]|nr:amidohydrolase family protein [Bacteroidota bacterium]
MATEIHHNQNLPDFFDCNCILGKRSDRREGEPWSVDSLLKDMSYYNIKKALVTYAPSKDYDAIFGNHQLITQISAYKNLLPVWTIVPPHTPEMPLPKKFFEDSEKHGIVAFTAFPILQNFSLNNWSCGELLKEIQKSHKPLLLPFSQTNWEEIHNLCSQYPNLSIIVHTVNYRQLRFLLPLWKIHSNLYVDTSWFSILDIIPFLEENNLIKHLLFGSNYPSYTPGASITLVTYANTSDQIKRSIACDNLQNIINNIIQ